MPLPIIPAPQKVVAMEGVCRLDAYTQILSSHSAALEGQYLADILGRRIGSMISMNAALPRSSSYVELRVSPEYHSLGKEGYRLSVDSNSIAIHAAAPAGAFHGIQTLLQLLPESSNSPLAEQSGPCTIPCVEIEDHPRFGWRGAMLDVSRYFLPKEFVLKFIDLLAMHKMNVLHLHLTDDQGWRIEIKKYPRLTSVGSVREKTLQGLAGASPKDDHFNPALESFDGVPHGGYYTQEQAKEIVAYAAARHILVMPEIEMPGHSQAAIAAYPYLGSSDESLTVSPRWGIHEAIYRPSEPTFEFLRDVLSEIMEIFPSPFIHIGGDEALKTQWRKNPETQALKSSLGLQNEDEVQSYFIRRMDEFLSSKGRTLVGWDEILEGGLSPSAVVMSWRGEKGGIAAVEQDHDVIMTPDGFTYLDYRQSADRDKEPLSFPNVLTLPTLYGYDPIPAEISQERKHHVLGAQCQLWSEYLPNVRQVEYMAFPRLCAFAEVAWTDRENKDYANFMERLPRHLRRLEALGVNYRPIASA